jgi:peptide deformylase
MRLHFLVIFIFHLYPNESLILASRHDVLRCASLTLPYTFLFLDNHVTTAACTPNIPTASGVTRCRNGNTNNNDEITNPVQQQGFPYSSDWTGTRLSRMDLEQSALIPPRTPTGSLTPKSWDMGRWPDPILRHSALPVDERWYGTECLQHAAHRLIITARDYGAVGLAAQQCGVDARMVYLERTRPSRRSSEMTSITTETATATNSFFVMINPAIVQRSPESEMKVWTETCLVLPPPFRATVLRDAWIDVEYYDVNGVWHSERLRGELARAAQHELDHDRGILTLDHIDPDEMENDVMRSIERPGHDVRQQLAFARAVSIPHSHAVAH